MFKLVLLSISIVNISTNKTSSINKLLIFLRIFYFNKLYWYQIKLIKVEIKTGTLSVLAL